MSRHKRKQQAAYSDRISRVLAARDELARAAGLDPAALTGATKLRFEQGAVLAVTRDGLHARAMAGDVSVVPVLERVNAMLVDILPKPTEALTVTFNQTIQDSCPSCGFTRAAPNSPAIDPVTGQGVPDPVEAPVTSVAEPKPEKVIPIKKQRPEQPATPPKSKRQ